MNNVKLNSLGCIVTDEGTVFPMNEEAVNTGCFNQNDGVPIEDCVDEWWEGMSMEDMTTLFPFLAETDLYDTEGYLTWALSKGELVEEANEISLGEYKSEVI